ncbi:MAG: hypothetical protein ABI867_22255 [Kofleriaceae bacterium]
MRALRAVAGFAFVMACGGGSPPVAKPEAKADPIPTTAGPECKAVAAHLVTVVLADRPDIHGKAVPLIAQHCHEDKWNDEVRSCMATASNDDESDACAKKLTDQQRIALEADAKRVMASDDDGVVAAPPPVPTSVAPAAPESAPKSGKGTTRGATKKDGGSKPADPCQGGESK